MNMFKTTSAKSAEEYIDLLEEPRKGQIKELHQFILKTVPKLKPFIISGMIGYGKYRYKYASGREGDWCVIALASQKNYISVYICSVKDGKYLPEIYKNLLARSSANCTARCEEPCLLHSAKRKNKVSIGKSCIRFKKIEDIDLEVLKKILKEAEKSPMSSA